jgi:hypothetical protein
MEHVLDPGYVRRGGVLYFSAAPLPFTYRCMLLLVPIHYVELSVSKGTIDPNLAQYQHNRPIRSAKTLGVSLYSN